VVGSSVSDWVDEELLAGDSDDVCLWLGGPVSRRVVRDLVAVEQRTLSETGLTAGGSVALRLPPSLAYIATLLAAWRLGAQVILLDHRLTDYEAEQATARLAPQVLVRAARTSGGGAMRGYAEVVTSPLRLNGERPATPHALVQLSSGSTGPSKVIARTAADLVAELRRYDALAAGAEQGRYPGSGDCIVLLSSVVHVLGLVGGLLYSLHAGLLLAFPDRMTADGILAAAAVSGRPVTVLGVPFHAELLAGSAAPAVPPGLTRMVVAGELTRQGVPAAFSDRFGVPLGSMYGMTELGVIATDLSGAFRPAVKPAPGMRLRVADGELQVAMPASPYIGLVDPGRWSGGWLRTKDAAMLDEHSGHVRILGRLDSQVSVGGLKVDLTEVEHTICGLPAIAEAVVTFDDAIGAYLVLREGASLADAEDAIASRLAGYKRPRRLYVLGRLPRTATGKIVRDQAVLRAVTDPAVTR
jgi:3-hydroxy-4-methylanthranilate adenylyltransferase